MQIFNKSPFTPLKLPSRHFDVVVYLGSLIAMLISSTYKFYGWTDPVDVIYGGALITKGIMPYVGFFSHHMPFPYFLAASLHILSNHSLVIFQLLFILGLWFWLMLLYRWIVNEVGRRAASTFVAFVVLGSTLVFSQSMLAETLIAYTTITLLCAFSFRYLKVGYIFRLIDCIAVSTMLAVIILSSLAYVGFVFYVQYYSFSHLESNI